MAPTACNSRRVWRSGTGSGSMTAQTRLWAGSFMIAINLRTCWPRVASSTATSWATASVRCDARLFNNRRDHNRMRSGMRRSSSACPVGAMSIKTLPLFAWTRSRMRKMAKSSSTPGGTISSRAEKISFSKVRSTWRPPDSMLNSEFNCFLMRAAHKRNSETESISTAAK